MSWFQSKKTQQVQPKAPTLPPLRPDDVEVDADGFSHAKNLDWRFRRNKEGKFSSEQLSNILLQEMRDQMIERHEKQMAMMTKVVDQLFIMNKFLKQTFGDPNG